MNKGMMFILTAACAGTVCFSSLNADKVSAGSNGEFEYDIISEEKKTCRITEYNNDNDNKTVIIPETIDGYTVIKIGNDAIEYSHIKKLHIPRYVESIGDISFVVDSITVDENNKFYDSRDNCNALIETATNTLILASNKTTSIPADVTAIGDGAFSGLDKIKEITIPASVKKIGAWAFKSCVKLEKVDLPEGLTLIGFEAFRNCKSLKHINLPDSLEWLMKKSFSECGSLDSIRIPANLRDSDLKSVFSESSIDYISVAEGNAFYDSRENCNAIIEKSTDTLLVGSNNSTIPASVKKIGDLAFSNRNGITEISIPDTVTEIGERAFDNCVNLKKVRLPANLKSIEAFTFYNTSLKEIKIPEGVTIIRENAFSDSKLKKVTLPDSLKTIEDNAFYCPLTSLYIPKNLKNAAWGSGVPFKAGSLKSIKVDPDNPYYDSRDNCNAVIEKSSGKLVLACNKTTIPASVKKIGYKAFCGLNKISRINIPKGVRSFEGEAFDECKNLTAITFASGTKTIPDFDAYGCRLNSITIPKSVKRIRENYSLQDLKTIYYKGSKADWKKIKVDEPKVLKHVKIVYNSKK